MEQDLVTLSRTNKFGHICLRVFTAFFCILFSLVFIGVVFFNDYYAVNTVKTILAIIAFLLAVYLLNILLEKYTSFFEKRFSLILGICVVAILAVNILTSVYLRYDPAYDLAAIFKGGIAWAESGIFAVDPDLPYDPNYFYYFPNNLGGLTFYYLLIKPFFLIGITDYYMVAATANSILVCLTILLSVLIAKRIYDTKKAYITLFFFIASMPFYISGAVFYTDVITLIYPVLMLYLYLRLLDTKTLVRQVLYGALIGLTCVIGMLIKFTVVIALIAIILYHLCSKGITKRFWMPFASGIAIILIVFMGFNSFIYSSYLNDEELCKLETPRTHWIMMSLSGNGTYNVSDYEFTKSFSEPDERKAAINAEIKKRINELGFSGIMKLFSTKSRIAFGDATFAQSDFLDDNPVYNTVLQDTVLYNGQHFNTYKLICSGSFFGIILLMLIWTWYLLFSRQAKLSNLIPQLCVFGILLFLCIWEVNGRYITNFIPMIYISGAPGGALVFRSINSMGSKKSKPTKV